MCGFLVCSVLSLLVPNSSLLPKDDFPYAFFSELRLECSDLNATPDSKDASELKSQQVNSIAILAQL